MPRSDHWTRSHVLWNECVECDWVFQYRVLCWFSFSWFMWFNFKLHPLPRGACKKRKNCTLKHTCNVIINKIVMIFLCKMKNEFDHNQHCLEISAHPQHPFTIEMPADEMNAECFFFFYCVINVNSMYTLYSYSQWNWPHLFFVSFNKFRNMIAEL